MLLIAYIRFSFDTALYTATHKIVEHSLSEIYFRLSTTPNNMLLSCLHPQLEPRMLGFEPVRFKILQDALETRAILETSGVRFIPLETRDSNL
jgi:hypothetical protein